MKSTLYTRKIRITDSIIVRVPSVGEILEDEDRFNESVFSIIATPYEMMVHLDDAGIDFTKISEFELFCLRFDAIKNRDMSLIFEELDLSRFVPAVNPENGEIILADPETNIVIDRCVHRMICDCLRKVLNMPKDDKRPGNEEARKYMLDRARAKLKRRMRQKDKQQSQIENYVIALVNTEQFPYNYETVLDLTIYQFYASLKQIIHKVQFDNTMIGCYAGTVKMSDLKPKERSWIQTS